MQKNNITETINGPSLSMAEGFTIGYESVLGCVSESSSIELKEGSHYLLARNGRGKTTLLRTLAGIVKPLKGGYNVSGRCQLLSEDLSFDSELTAKSIFKSLLLKSGYNEAMRLADQLELDVKKAYGKLSTGNKRKVGLLVAEFSVSKSGSDVLLLDEPFTGLDAFAREIFQNLWAEKSKGVIRLVSCHPDFDAMEIESSVLISDGEIGHLIGGDVPQQWGELKAKIN